MAQSRKELAREFPTREHLLFYLTPALSAPDEAEERNYWIPVDYASIEKILREEVVQLSTELHLQDDVRCVLQHYLDALRRYIVADSDDAKRCRLFYRKHKEALDL